MTVTTATTRLPVEEITHSQLSLIMTDSTGDTTQKKAWYKMIFFDCRGRAEPARMMMTLAGQQFIDERLTLEEWQQDMKPSK